MCFILGVGMHIINNMCLESKIKLTIIILCILVVYRVFGIRDNTGKHSISFANNDIKTPILKDTSECLIAIIYIMFLRFCINTLKLKLKLT